MDNEWTIIDAIDKPKLPQFDPDFSPNHMNNTQVAKAHGLRYDPSRRMYIDSEGYLVRDEFGQSL